MMSNFSPLIGSDYPFPPKPGALSDQEKDDYKTKIKQLLIDKDAVLVAHYYTDP